MYLSRLIEVCDSVCYTMCLSLIHVQCSSCCCPVVRCECVFAFFAEVHINLEEGVKLARDICLGMTYIHTLEPLVQRFDLNPHNVLVGVATPQTCKHTHIHSCKQHILWFPSCMAPYTSHLFLMPLWQD